MNLLLLEVYYKVLPVVEYCDIDFYLSVYITDVCTIDIFCNFSYYERKPLTVWCYHFLTQHLYALSGDLGLFFGAGIKWVMSKC